MMYDCLYRSNRCIYSILYSYTAIRPETPNYEKVNLCGNGTKFLYGAEARHRVSTDYHRSSPVYHLGVGGWDVMLRLGMLCAMGCCTVSGMAAAPVESVSTQRHMHPPACSHPWLGRVQIGQTRDSDVV